MPKRSCAVGVGWVALAIALTRMDCGGITDFRSSTDGGACGDLNTSCCAGLSPCHEGYDCRGGTCVAPSEDAGPCPASLRLCDRRCVDTSTDNDNCGSCGQVCDADTEPCTSGTCGCAGLAGSSVKVCDRKCVDTATDNANCGGCGKSCAFACTNGTCEPLEIEAAREVSTLIAGANNVYWIDTTSAPTWIFECPLTGCSTSPFALTALDNLAGNLVMCGGTFFWGDNLDNSQSNLIESCPVSGCVNPSILASGQSPSWVACDSTSVYWINADLTLMACSQSSCTPTKLTTGFGQPYPYPYPNQQLLVIDGTTLVWTDNANNIESCAVTGCPTPTVLAAGQRVNQLAAAGGQAFWTSSVGVFACSDTACNNAPTLLAAGEANPWGIASDGTNVYWVDNAGRGAGGSVKRCSVMGCGGVPTLVASDRDYPQLLALSPSKVVWVEVGPTIWAFGK